MTGHDVLKSHVKTCFGCFLGSQPQAKKSILHTTKNNMLEKAAAFRDLEPTRPCLDALLAMDKDPWTWSEATTTSKSLVVGFC